ncbi:hypothetical protein EXIGLDRAFT_759923 [Exidia glandulosa HHB12029]|uniref:t-SNARE coiled-coil homology domain-containing protein n=1 Tax=Exidia glandulosa HHB12029 TaxID=1314781 RepID=A0A165PNH1_EXIGL|nr:hypothetical protein EXIGLDRAFT_759923 [Exidia glandulosa HHB12029]
MSFFRRKESPAIPPPNDPQQGNRLQRAPPQDRYGSPAPGGYGQPQAGYGGGQDRYGSPAPDRYGAAPDRYGAAPDRYGAAPDRYGAPAPAPAPGRYGGQQQPDRYGASPAPAQDRYGGQQLQQSGGYGQQQPDRYARASPAPNTSRLRQGPTAGDPYSHRPDANVDADRAALFAGYNPEGPRRLQRDDQRQAPTEADWDRRRAEGADEEEDVEAIKQSIRTTKQESLASTRNALRIAREAEETAANTLLKLGDQSEKLGDAERHIDVAKYNSMKAEDKVDELKQLNKSIFRPVIVFNKDKKRAAQEAKMLARHEEERDERERNAYEVRESQNRIGNAYSAGRQNSYGSAGGSGDQYGEEGVGAPQRGGYGSYRTQEQQNVRKAQRSRYQFEATGSDDEIEDELDDNLDGIGDAVGRMKSLALAMGQEVDRQNDRLTKFEKKTDDVDVAVVRNTNRLKKY